MRKIKFTRYLEAATYSKSVKYHVVTD